MPPVKVFRVVGTVAVLAVLGSIPITSRPAAAARWVQWAPPTPSYTVVYDTNRNRALVITERTIWAVSGDPEPLWTQIHTGAPPPAAFFVYHPEGDRIVAASFTYPPYEPGEVWTLSLATPKTSWVGQAYTGDAPLARGKAVYDPIRQRVIVFGGSMPFYPPEPTNQVNILTLSGTPHWSTASPVPPAPSGRTETVGVYDPWRDRMIFYGGRTTWGFDPPNVVDEAWALSMTEPMTWTFLTPTQHVAYARTRALGVLDEVGQRMIVTGGEGPGAGPVFSYGRYNDTWALDLSPSAPADAAFWTPIAADPGDTRPPARTEAIAWYDRVQSRTLRYGGDQRADLWALDSSVDPAWTTPRPDSLHAPRRVGHIGMMDDAAERWLVALGVTGDVWQHPEGLQKAWNPIATGGPGVRYWAGVAHDAADSRALVFGGSLTESPNSAGSDRSDLWSFDYATSSWTLLTPPASPPARREALVVFDPVRRRLIVNGGRYTDFNNQLRPRRDTWAYDVASNTWSQLAAGTHGRWAAAGIYDPIRDRILAFGGIDTTGAAPDLFELPMSAGAWSTLVAEGAIPDVANRPRAVRAAYDAVGDRMIAVTSDGVGWLEAYALSLGPQPTWEGVPMDNFFMPRMRENYAFAADPAGLRLIVSGGEAQTGGTDYTDTWELYLDPPPVAVSAMLLSSDAAPDRVRLVWRLSPGVVSASVERRVPGGTWSRLATMVPDGNDRVVLEDRDVHSGKTYEYRLGFHDGSAERFMGEVTVTVPLRATLSLAGAQPNPVSGALHVSFALADRSPATLDLLDVAGRRVLSRDVGDLGPGAHRLILARDAKSLGAGLYFLRLSQRGESRTSRVVMLK